MKIDDDFLELYELFKKLAPPEPERGVVVYYPDLFISMAEEILSLRKELREYKVRAGEALMQREYANRLYDQLQCIKRDLDNLGVRLPYKFR